MTARRRAVLVAAWLAATGLIVACARTIDWTRAAEALATVVPAWLALGVACNAAILAAWALFWRTLLPRGERGEPVDGDAIDAGGGADAPSGGTNDDRARYGVMFEIVSAASALMNTLPFGGGHASSVALLARRATTMRGALSVMALDQLGEGVTKVTIFLLVAALAPLPGWMRAGVTTACAAVAAWFIALVVASRWAAELAILRRPGRALGAWCCVLLMKGAELAAIAAVQRAFGLSISFSGTLLVLAAVVLGTMLPLAPANLGTYEASAFLAYRYLGATPAQALSVAVVQHVCFLIPSVGIGYAFLSARTLARSAIASR